MKKMESCTVMMWSHIINDVTTHTYTFGEWIFLSFFQSWKTNENKNIIKPFQLTEKRKKKRKKNSNDVLFSNALN